MKKTLSTMLIGSMLLMPIPALATENEDLLHKLDFDKIAEEIEDRSPSVKVLNNLIESTDESFEIQEDAIREQMISAGKTIESTKGTLAGQIGFYESLILYYQGLKVQEESGAKRAEVIESYNEAIEGYNVVVTSLKDASDKLTLPSSSDDDWEDDLDDIRDLTISKVRISAQMGRDGQVYAAEKLFLSYKDLEDQLNDMENKYVLLQKQRDILKLQQELGLVTQTNAASLEVTIKNLKTGIDTMEKTLLDLKGSINLAFGQEYDTPLELGAIPSIEWTKIRAMDYDEDYDTALQNNYNVRQKRIEYALKDEEYDQADGDAEDKAEIERDSAEIQLEDLKRKFVLTFDQTYRAVKDKQTALDNEWYVYFTKQTEWSQAQLKYNLGLMSKIDWESAKQTYDSAYLKYSTAQKVLTEAYLNYEWLLNGMEFASSAQPASGTATSSATSSDRGF